MKILGWDFFIENLDLINKQISWMAFTIEYNDYINYTDFEDYRDSAINNSELNDLMLWTPNYLKDLKYIPAETQGIQLVEKIIRYLSSFLSLRVKHTSEVTNTRNLLVEELSSKDGTDAEKKKMWVNIFSILKKSECRNIEETPKNRKELKVLIDSFDRLFNIEESINKKIELTKEAASLNFELDNFIVFFKEYLVQLLININQDKGIFKQLKENYILNIFDNNQINIYSIFLVYDTLHERIYHRIFNNKEYSLFWISYLAHLQKIKNVSEELNNVIIESKKLNDIFKNFLAECEKKGILPDYCHNPLKSWKNLTLYAVGEYLHQELPDDLFPKEAAIISLFYQTKHDSNGAIFSYKKLPLTESTVNCLNEIYSAEIHDKICKEVNERKRKSRLNHELMKLFNSVLEIGKPIDDKNTIRFTIRLHPKNGDYINNRMEVPLPKISVEEGEKKKEHDPPDNNVTELEKMHNKFDKKYNTIFQ